MWLLNPPGVYAPQADSDLLADALRREKIVSGARVLDIGTGTGVLAVEAAREGAAHVTAVDISGRAVATARVNAFLRGLDVDVVRGDLTGPVRGRCFDLVLSNPPYVPGALSEGQSQSQGQGTDQGRFGSHAPVGAWNGGRDGRALLDRVCRDAPPLLAPGGVLLLVHSAICGVDLTLRRLADAGLRADIVARRRIPFGPVLRSRARWLESRGLIRPGEREEDLVVIRARS